MLYLHLYVVSDHHDTKCQQSGRRKDSRVHAKPPSPHVQNVNNRFGSSTWDVIQFWFPCPNVFALVQQKVSDKGTLKWFIPGKSKDVEDRKE